MGRIKMRPGKIPESQQSKHVYKVKYTTGIQTIGLGWTRATLYSVVLFVKRHLPITPGRLLAGPPFAKLDLWGIFMTIVSWLKNSIKGTGFLFILIHITACENGFRQGNVPLNELAVPIIESVAGNTNLVAISGSTHDCWTGGSPNCVSQMIATSNGDATYSANFQNLALGQQYQSAGILVYQDTTNFLRFEAHSDGNSIVYMAGYKVISNSGLLTFKGSNVRLGTSTILQVAKVSNVYTFKYSLDGGTSYITAGSVTQTLNVTSTGPYVDNCCGSTAPAVSANVQDSIQPIVSIPAAPTNLTAQSASSSSVQLKWADNSNNETGFNIYSRATNGTAGFALRAQVAAGVNSYTDINLTTYWQYDYQIVAYNSAGSSSPSTSVTVQVLPNPAPSPTPTPAPTPSPSPTPTALAHGTYVFQSGSVVVDGGFGYFGNTPAVQFYSPISGNLYQEWTYTSLGTLQNVGYTGYFMTDAGNGTVSEATTGDSWTILLSGSSYAVKNNRTGNYLTNSSGTLVMAAASAASNQLFNANLVLSNPTPTPTPIPTPAVGISVMTYGATGNGSTDDKNAIQNAINACPSGGTILFPAGIYKITAAINMKSNCSYVGQNNPIVRGYTGTGPSGYSLFTTGGSNITVTGITFDGGGIFLPVEMQSGIFIRGNRFQNILNSNGGFGPWQAALFIGATMLNSSIDHNAFYNIMDGGNNMVTDGQMAGIHAWLLSQVTISDNSFDYVQQGMSISESTVSQCTLSAYVNDKIQRNTFTHVRRMPIEIQAQKLQGLLIEDNVGTNFINTPFWNTFGISAALDGTGTIIRRNRFDTRGNTGTGGGYCLEIGGSGTLVDSNTCAGTGQWSVGVMIGGGPDAIVSNNILCGGFRDGATAYEPPHVETTGHPAKFSNNTVSATCP